MFEMPPRMTQLEARKISNLFEELDAATEARIVELGDALSSSPAFGDGECRAKLVRADCQE
jgi:hypothetical protein